MLVAWWCAGVVISMTMMMTICVHVWGWRSKSRWHRQASAYVSSYNSNHWAKPVHFVTRTSCVVCVVRRSVSVIAATCRQVDSIKFVQVDLWCRCRQHQHRQLLARCMRMTATHKAVSSTHVRPVGKTTQVTDVARWVWRNEATRMSGILNDVWIATVLVFPPSAWNYFINYQLTSQPS